MRRKHLRDAAMLNLSSAGEKAVTLLRSSDFNQSQLQFTTRSERVITQSQSQRLSWDGGGANSRRVKKGNRSQGHRPELPLCREDQICHEEQYIKSDYDKGKNTFQNYWKIKLFFISCQDKHLPLNQMCSSSYHADVKNTVTKLRMMLLLLLTVSGS